MPKIYLDWAATAIPNITENAKACEIATELFANPSAKHELGKKARQRLEEARKKIAQVLSVNSNEIFFTSGGTESDHIVILSNIARNNFSDYSLAMSAVEHQALSENKKSLEKLGLEILTVPCDKSGFINAKTVLQKLKPNTNFVSIMTVNNELGNLQPIPQIAKALKERAGRKTFFHTDAVQAVGKNLFNIAELGVDALSLSGHKIGAMRGIGLLFLKNKIEVFNKGGNQESGIRSGTENLAGVLSLQFALEKYAKNFTQNLELAYSKMNFLINEISKLPNFFILPQTRQAESKNFSPYILQLAHKKITGEIMVRVLSDKGFYISTGSACSSSKLQRPVLDALGISKELQMNAFRISLGNETSFDELKLFVKALKQVDEEFC